jgi:CPA2 family monovalent cation:H+ antiporter-2
VPHGEIFKDLLILLAVAGIVVPLFGRVSFGSVAAFLIAGVIVGPGGLGRFVTDVPWLEWVSFTDPERVQPFAELGVLFVLFIIGLGMPLRRLLEMRKLVLGLGSAQVLASAAVIGAITFLYGGSPGFSIALGLGLALSSTAVVAQLLAEERRLATPVGRTAMAVLLFQDAMVVPIVIVIGLLGQGLSVVPIAVLGALAIGIVAVAVIVFAGRFVVTPLLRLAARSAGREAVVAIALFMAVGLAMLTEAIGLSTALGAFLAGLLIGESEYRYQVEVDIDPFKGLLIGLFFMTVGMSFDPALLMTSFGVVVASVAGLIVVKAMVMFPLALAFGVKRPVAAEVAILLAGAGEFAFVVLSLARDARLVAPEAHQFFVAVAAMALLITPALAYVGGHVARLLEKPGEGPKHAPGAGDGDYVDHVVIGGFGRVGRLIADVLDAEQIAYVGLDLDADLVAVERAAGRRVYYGDATRREILERVGGRNALAFVVTTDEADAEEAMVQAIREAWPDAMIHARAKDQVHAARLRGLGATTAVPETLEASLQVAGEVLAAQGLTESAILSRLARQRRAEIEALRATSHSPPAGAAAPSAPSRPVR